MNNLFDIAPVVSQKSNEWYTPAKYVDAARKVMGSIDLDPASCEAANRTIKATWYYSLEDDGLSKEWHGNVWLNPPYGLVDPLPTTCRFKSGGASPKKRSMQTVFVAKALKEYRDGNITQSVLLVTANTTVTWFQSLWDYPMCTPFPKIGFLVPGLSERQYQVFGNVFVYLGPNEQKFIDIFSEFGRIAKAIDTPKAKVAPLSLWEVSV